MATIDSKVVEMRFDNKQFESGISQSMNSLNKLKATLKFDGVIDSKTLNGIAKGVDYLASRFTALGQVINNVKMQAIAMVKSLTVDQIGAGWDKYNEIIASTQTIMSATAKNWTSNKKMLKDQDAQMEYVTKQLNKLNAFTDETSANLTDMTSNIGKFTSAGVKLDVATDAMMGIATWGYKSGASVQQMSHAMYNLSQAMGMGALRVQDWMSIENANMATEEFKRTAIQTAIALGKLKKDSTGNVYAFQKVGKSVKAVKVTTENFRSTLSAGWLNSKVLTTTLKKYGDFSKEILEMTDNTGVSVTKLMKYIGDAKKGTLKIFADKKGKVFTKEFQEIINKEGVEDAEAFAKSIKKLSGSYYDLGYSAFKASQEAKTFKEAIDYTKDAVSTGWMNTFKTIVGNYLQAKDLWTAVTEEMYEVFIEDLENQNEVLKGWAELGGRESLLEGIANIWSTIKSVIFSIKGAWKEVFPPATAEKLKDLTDKFKSMTWILKLTEDQSKKLQSVFKLLFEGFKYIGNSFKNIFNTIKDALDFNDILPKDFFQDEGIFEWLKGIIKEFNSLAFTYEITEDKASRFFVSFSNIIAGIKNIVSSITNVVKAISKAFKKIFPPDFISGGIFESIAVGFGNITEIFKITDERAEKLQKMFEGLFAILDIVKMVIVGILGPITDFTEENNDLADGVFDVVAALGSWIKAFRDWLKEDNKLTNFITAIVTFFKDLPQKIDDASVFLTGMHIGEVFDKIKDKVKDAWDYISGVFKRVKEDLGILFGKNKDLSKSTDNAGKSFNAFELLEKHLETLKKGFEVIKPYLDQIKQFFKDTIDFKWPSMEEMGDGLVKGGQFAALAMITSMFYELATFFKSFKKDGKMIAKSFSNFMNTLSGSIKSLGKTIEGNIKAQTFKTVATAVLELAAAIFVLALLPADKLMTATFAVGAMMAELAFAFGLISRTKTSKDKLEQIKKMLGMVELILATIVGGIFLIASQTDIDTAIVAASMIAVLLGEVALFLKLMESTKFTKAQAEKLESMFKSLSIMMVAMGAALMLATKNGDWKEIAAAGTVLGGMLFAIAGAMHIMPKSKELKEMAGAMAAVSAAMLILGLGVAIVAANGDWKSIGMAGLVMAGMILAIAAALRIVDPKNAMASAGAIAVVAAGMLLLAVGLAALSKLNLESVAIALGTLAGALAIVLLAGLGAQYVAAGLMALGVAIALIGAGAALAGAGLWLVAQAIQTIVSLGPEGISGFLDGLTNFFERLPDMATNAAEAFINFIQGIVDGKTTIIEGLATIFEAIITALRRVFPMLNELIKEMLIGGIQTLRAVFPVLNEFIKEFILGGLETLKAITPEIVDFIILFTKEVLRSLREIVPDLTATLIFILKDTLTQIRDNIEEIISLSVEIGILTITGFLKGLMNQIPNIVDTGIEFVLALINGIADGIEKHAEDMRKTMENLVNSLINAFCTLLGIRSPSTVFNGFGDNIVQGLINGISEMIGKAKDAIKDLANKVLTKFCEIFGIEKPNSPGELKDFAIQIIQGFNAGIYNMIDKAKNMIKDFADRVLTAVCEKFGIKKPSDPGELKTFAVQLINGFIKGINDKIKSAVSAIGNFCKSITDKVKKVFDIHSPSRVFMKFGEYLDEGLAIGIRNYSGVAEDATENMSNNVIDNMSSVLSGLTSMFDEGFEDPTIKPVLDLTDVTNGLGVMDDMLSSNRSIALSGYASQASNSISNQATMASMFDQLKATLGGTSRENQNGVVNNNTFNITGDDPYEIANEVSRILQDEVERRNAVWGR